MAKFVKLMKLLSLQIRVNLIALCIFCYCFEFAIAV